MYWKAREDSEPEHWLSADSAATKAHTGDETYAELLAGFPQGGRDEIRHAITHLHTMVHIATDIVALRAAEPYEVFADQGRDSEADQKAAARISSTMVSDALAGIDGVARLYTGSVPLTRREDELPKT